MEQQSGGLMKSTADLQEAVHSKSPYFQSAAERQTSVLLLRSKTSQQHYLVTSLATRCGSHQLAEISCLIGPRFFCLDTASVPFSQQGVTQLQCSIHLQE